MTSREHARRLMLILLASEGTAMRRGADEPTARRERSAGGGDEVQGSADTKSDGQRERDGEEWRMWLTARPPAGSAEAAATTPTPLGVA